MASPFSHAAAALSLGTCFPQMPRRVWIASAVCSALPDLDVIGFRFRFRYGDFWGHRGFTHSLAFAALLAGVLVAFGRVEVFPLKPKSGPSTSSGQALSGPLSRVGIFAYLFLATASHGVLDAITDGGLGVAFFSPFDNRRYFLPWRPVHVSPIGVTRFFSARGVAVFRSELVWIWVLAVVFAAVVLAARWIVSFDLSQRQK